MSNNGDLLKLSQDFHKKIDANDRRLHQRLDTFVDKVGEKIGDAVTAIQSTADQVEQIMNDRPCAEVQAVKRDVDEHLDAHKSVKSLVLTWILRIVGGVVLAYLLVRMGLSDG